MKRIAVALACALIAGGCAHDLTTGPIRRHFTDGALSRANQAGSDWQGVIDRFAYPPIDTDIPHPRRVTLNNGVRVLLIPDHELPLVNVQAMFRAGSVWDPVGKSGLAALTGAALRAGGTRRLTPDRLDERLENMAAILETAIGEESGSASLSALSKDIDAGLTLLTDLLTTPRFDAQRLELVRARMIDAVRRQNDEPEEIGMREVTEKIYDHTGYGDTPTIASLKRIGRDDVRAFHKRYIVPDETIIGVTGDFDEEKIVDRLEATIGRWRGGASSPAIPPVVPDDSDAGLWLFDKEAPQAVIRMGHAAALRTDPDYHALRVMDEILGGNGFSSRLMQKIRTERGLSYSVWSAYIGGRWNLGRFLIGVDTKVATADEAIRLTLAEVERIRTEPVTDEELAVARDSIVNSFVFIFDTPGRIMDQWLTLAYYDMPESYLLEYRDKIMAVTRDDVRRAAEKHLSPDRLAIVVVGPAAELSPKLAPFGKPEIINPDAAAPSR
jgi:predicted Zn-dependent peptidase